MALYPNEKSKLKNHLEKAIDQIQYFEDIADSIAGAEHKLGTSLLNKAATIRGKLEDLIRTVNKG